MVQLSHSYMTTRKTIALTRRTFVGKVLSLLSNMLFRLVIIFLPRSERLLISWLQSPSAVILEPPKIKSLTVSIVSPSIYYEVMGPDAMILVFWMLSLCKLFSLSSFTFMKRLFSSSSLFAISVLSSAYLRLLIFLPAILIPACVSSSHSISPTCRRLLYHINTSELYTAQVKFLSTHRMALLRRKNPTWMMPLPICFPHSPFLHFLLLCKCCD